MIKSQLHHHRRSIFCIACSRSRSPNAKYELFQVKNIDIKVPSYFFMFSDTKETDWKGKKLNDTETFVLSLQVAHGGVG